MSDVPVEKLQVILNLLIMEFISLELLLQIKKQDHDTGLLCNIYLCGRSKSSYRSYNSLRCCFIYLTFKHFTMLCGSINTFWSDNGSNFMDSREKL